MAGSPIGDEKLNQNYSWQKSPPVIPNAAFMKPVQPNEALAAIVGAKPLPRTELTRRSGPTSRRTATGQKGENADQRRRKARYHLQSKKAVSMFEMTALVSKNLVK